MRGNGSLTPRGRVPSTRPLGRSKGLYDNTASRNRLPGAARDVVYAHRWDGELSRLHFRHVAPGRSTFRRAKNRAVVFIIRNLQATDGQLVGSRSQLELLYSLP